MIITSRRWMAVVAASTLVAGLAISSAPVAASTPSAATPFAAVPVAQPPLANLAHLDFLLDTATPAAVDEHTTYRLAEEPALTMPWTYADARDGGTFERVGGGPLDPATGYWGQGAFNSDDITRIAVVYVRHWQQTGSENSRQKAYELLRSVAYFQTFSGPNAGNVVLWMQPDGTLNPSPEPVELPDPSDSGESYWQARTLWALGEGYAAFVDEDPEFASFLQQRLQLSVGALERQTLDKYGEYAIADGVQVPAWLIVNGADASAEAVLGLAAYAAAAPDDAGARSALAALAEGVAKMGSGDLVTWPYGAILPWAESQSMWHAWSSQMPAALAAASTALNDPSLLDAAIVDSAQFTPVLLTGGGPDNGWFPTPTDTVQIAYGADSRLQSLLAVADAADKPGIRELAGMMGAWFFGMNAAGEPVYSPETGVTFDGVQADGSINRNSGAESTIHGLLAMLALDAHPEVAARAQSVTTVAAIDGLTVVEAESSTATTGSVVTPESAWTGESLLGGGAYLELASGENATLAMPAASGARHIEAVTIQPNPGSSASLWRSGRIPLGVVRHGVGDQGITAAPGALRPQTVTVPLLSSLGDVSARAVTGTVNLDSVILRPLVSRLLLTGEAGSTELVHSTSRLTLRTVVGVPDDRATVTVYDATGAILSEREVDGRSTITLKSGGFAIVSR
jgi:hypothetical protein